jgi:hypothetical protein
MKLVDISTEAESETGAWTCAGATSMNYLCVFKRGLRVGEQYGLNLSPRHAPPKLVRGIVLDQNSSSDDERAHQCRNME